MRVRPGTCVVFEGLDGAGKSTQLAAFADLGWSSVSPEFVHIPSGLSSLTEAIYQLTENETISSPLARQLLHLACHAEAIGDLREARGTRGLFLDRWWWSMVAYGWFGGGLRNQLDPGAFFGAIDMVWSVLEADAVLLFLNPVEIDSRNLREVTEGYEWLAQQYPETTVLVPPGSPAITTKFLLTALTDRGLLAP